MIDNELGKNDKTRLLLRKAKLYYGESSIGKAYGKQSPQPDGDRWSKISSLEQVWIAGTRWIGGRWCWTGFRWCRKRVAGSGLVVAGAELVVAGICWCRKVAAGFGVVVAGVCWCWKVVAGFRTVSCWCLMAVSKGIRLDFLN